MDSYKVEIIPPTRMHDIRKRVAIGNAMAAACAAGHIDIVRDILESPQFSPQSDISRYLAAAAFEGRPLTLPDAPPPSANRAIVEALLGAAPLLPYTIEPIMLYSAAYGFREIFKRAMSADITPPAGQKRQRLPGESRDEIAASVQLFHAETISEPETQSHADTGWAIQMPPPTFCPQSESPETIAEAMLKFQRDTLSYEEEETKLAAEGKETRLPPADDFDWDGIILETKEPLWMPSAHAAALGDPELDETPWRPEIGLAHDSDGGIHDLRPTLPPMRGTT